MCGDNSALSAAEADCGLCLAAVEISILCHNNQIATSAVDIGQKCGKRWAQVKFGIIAGEVSALSGTPHNY